MLIPSINAIIRFKNAPMPITKDQQMLTKVKIYSNLAEIIEPLGKLPLEFSAEDWSNIRSDSLTLIGSNINVTRQTITEKKNSLNNHAIYVRSPSSSQTETKFLKATMIDENRNLVKLIDNNISKEPIFFTVPFDHILHINEPPQSKYFVDFTYYTTDIAYVSYLRSNLNWKTRYQLYLFEESMNPILIAMADIRNNGKSNFIIQHGELLGGDINLQMSEQQKPSGFGAETNEYRPEPSVGQGTEIAGLYVFTINQPLSIDAKTNYLLPMFRPQVNVERFVRIHQIYFNGAGKSIGKAVRTYRLSSDRFLSRGNCMIREYDHLVGETFLPNLAAKNKYEFSIGEDSDIVYNETVTLVSSRTYNETIKPDNRVEQRIQSIYNVDVLLKNFKKNRSVKAEYKQIIYGRSVKLVTSSNDECIQDGTILECKMTLEADEEKLLLYKIEIIN